MPLRVKFHISQQQQQPTCTLFMLSLPADAHQLQAWYSLPLEVARAVQAVGVNAVVGEHLLPQASGGDACDSRRRCAAVL